MNRLSLVVLVAALSAATGAESDVVQDSRAVAGLKIPAKVKIGHVGDRVREIQATLNKKLGGRVIRLPDGSEVGPVLLGDGSCFDPQGHPGIDLRDYVRQLLLSDGRDLRIRGNWVPCRSEEDRMAIDESLLGKETDGVKYLCLPESPLLVDGVYGQHTYSGVLMFQVLENLQHTGEVDAVTLDKLEPMIPPGRLLAGIMAWIEERGVLGRKLDKKADDYPLRIKEWSSVAATLFLLLLSLLVYGIARKLARAPEFLSNWLFAPRTSPLFQALIRKAAFVRMAQFAPALFVLFAARIVFPEPQPCGGDPFPYLDVFQKWQVYLSRLSLAYMAFIGTWATLTFVSTCDEVYAGGQEADHSIKGIISTAKRLVAFVGVVLVCSALAGRNPMFVVGGMGAFMAIIMLVFRGAILGLVASVQIVANKTVRVGDWIEIPKHGADGEVLEISLSTVKIRNFDKSISSIPTSNLLTESFRNWTEMQRSGGRRIKRSIHIDQSSIKVCTPEMIRRFEQIELIRGYIRKKKRELERHNKELGIGPSVVNSRQLTNIGTFRAYLEAYLAGHPDLRDDFTHLVRQRQPTETGLPIELYAFCSDTSLVGFEAVQADLFDHVLAILPEFGLRAFQQLGCLPGTRAVGSEQGGLDDS